MVVFCSTVLSTVVVAESVLWRALVVVTTIRVAVARLVKILSAG